MKTCAIKGGDFEIVLWAHHARGLEAEDASGIVGVVGVNVGRAAGDEKGDSTADFDGLIVEDPGHGAIDTEDGFVVFAMDMGNGVAGEGRNGEFKEIESAVGFVSSFEKSDAHLADADCLVH
jgi:hypothetical protein